MDQLDQAIYDTIHNSDLSAKEIAQRLGMGHQVLLNKANPQNETHKLTVRESLAIQLITGNHRIHSAMGTELEIANAEGEDRHLMEVMLFSCKEHGDVVSAIYSAIEDGRFTFRERETCLKEVDEAINSLNALKRIISIHETTETIKAVS